MTPERSETESRKLLRRLRDTLAEPGAGQERLDRIVRLIASSMRCEVCSIYLFRDEDTLELCATEGLKKESVHKTRMRLGEGLVGRVARTSTPVNTANAPAEKGFRFMPETGEEIYSSFLGVPIQRIGERLGVLVVQSREARQFSEDEVYAIEVVAMVLHFLQGTGPLPEFDELGRPSWQFRDTVHNRCVRGGYYEEGIFAKQYGDPECLVEIGCWGPVVQCNIVERGAIRHHGGCMNQGGICIGCTMPGFPDKFSPFYKRPPGSMASSTIAKASGTVVRFLRSFTRNSLNRETMWGPKGEIPSGWAAERRPEPIAERFVHYLYRMRQLTGAKAPGRDTSQTKFRDGFEVGPILRQQAEGGSGKSEPLPPPYARRQEKREREAGDRRTHGAIAPNLE